MKKISVASPSFLGNEKKYVTDCIDTTWISSGGKYIQKFEEQFADFCGTKYAASCCNGTVALHLALLALGIKEDDEVLMPVVTYIATANAVKYLNAVPVFVEIDRNTWNIDPEKIEEKITERTKAIIVVHLYGNPVDMDLVMDIARKYNLFVIEDAAEAHGALYKGKRVGSIGDIGTFSFFGNKVITTGEGGMVVTNNETLDQKVRLLKGQGVDAQKRYWHVDVGYNYRMTNIEAAIGLAQLEKVEEHIAKRISIGKRYYELLKDYSEYIVFQQETENSVDINWMTAIVFTDKVELDRDIICNRMAEKGIETRPIFYPINDMPPYKSDEEFVVANYVTRHGINLPTHSLLADEDIEYICKSLIDIIME